MASGSTKSSTTSTPSVRSSDVKPYAGHAWRFVESQSFISTLKITDTLEEQRILEETIERFKPSIPARCRHLDFLLSTPFRYKPYPYGSRFRRSGSSLGVFYCSENEETAAAEMAFYRLMFFSQSPSTPWPGNALTFTSFSVEIGTDRSIDTTRPELSLHRARWIEPIDYTACQALADEARCWNIDVIIFESVRDPDRKLNLAVLECHAFNRSTFLVQHTWNVRVGPFGVQALCQFPGISLSFDPETFAADPRVASMNWSRTTV